MKITINLATRPFVELRAVYMLLRAAAGALALLALAQWAVLHGLERKAELADANVSHWTHLTHDLEREWQQDQAMMREPQNTATLDKSEFLNGLFARKAFSWTAALMDLENVLPAGVQVVSMEPQMTKDGHVLLRLRVSGQRDKEVELVKNLEGSRHFLAPRIVGESAQQAPNARPGTMPQANASTDVNFDILTEYNPQRMEMPPSGATGEKTARTVAKPSGVTKHAAGGKGRGAS